MAEDAPIDPSHWFPAAGQIVVLPATDSREYRDLVDWLSQAYDEAVAEDGRPGPKTTRVGITAVLQMLAWRQQMTR